jgi:hypothetical protein
MARGDLKRKFQELPYSTLSRIHKFYAFIGSCSQVGVDKGTAYCDGLKGDFADLRPIIYDPFRNNRMGVLRSAESAYQTERENCEAGDRELELELAEILEEEAKKSFNRQIKQERERSLPHWTCVDAA